MIIFSLLSKLIPIQWLIAFGLGAVAFLGALIKGKSEQAKTQAEKVKVAEAIIENHAVAQKEEAATTDQEAYAALKADAQSDHS